MVSKNELVTVRKYKDSDLNFILATWLRGLYYGDSWFSLIDKKAFMKSYKPTILRILEDPSTEVYVSCLRDDSDVILAYSVLDKELHTLHYVFCKKAWRGIGLSKELVPQNIKTVTHLTKTGLSIIKKKNWSFNPFLIRG